MKHSISAIARLTDISIATVRFYERRGLVDDPERNAYGHRQYDGSHVARIRFIRRAQRLGFSLAEVRELIKLREAPGPHCAAVRQRTEHRLRQTQDQIADLEEIRESLSELMQACDGRVDTEQCPAFEALEA
jgi:DNA-binding transcriptional MerR regulator